MTINTTISNVKYNGNGITASFAITFPFLSSSDVKVILTDSSGNDANLTSPTHYSIDSSNNVVMVTPPASGEKLTIYRDTGITQNVDYIEGDSFPAQTHEAALDRLTMISQEIADDLAGALKLKKSSSSTADLTLPDPVANKTLAWNATADGLENGPSSIDITQAVTDAQAAQAAAEVAQSGAQTAEANTALIYDTFDDRYLGAKASDPATDNDGDPLIVGAEYWNTITNTRMTWDGVSWSAYSGLYASAVQNIPAGNVSSTDVQSVINELDADKPGKNINETISGAWTYSQTITLDNGLADTPEIKFRDPVNNTNIDIDQSGEHLRIITQYRGGTATVPFSIDASNGNTTVGGSITANSFIGDGSQLTNVGLTNSIPRPTKVSTNVIDVNGTQLTVPSPTPGTDYFFSLTAITTTKQADTIGGFHYSLTPDTETPTGNKTAADIAAISGINEYSIWTNWFRPTCDPSGMVHINGRWYDIYLLNSEHITNGSSKAGATIAGGALLGGRLYPKIPLEFGGTGTTNYGKFTWFQAAEIAASHGKSLISYAEFPSIAYGVAEQTDASLLDGGLANIEHYPTLTSKFGIEQASGTQWLWGKDVAGNRDEGSVTWAWGTGLTDSRGNIYALHNNHITVALLGGNHASGANAGSRASQWSVYVWHSAYTIGARLSCDHMYTE